MKVGIIETLVRCGALEPKKRGPTPTLDREEAYRLKMQKQAEASKRRRHLVKEARIQGEPVPVFKPGRPQKYTPEEAKEAKNTSNRISWVAHRARVHEGLERLMQLELERSCVQVLE